MIFGVLKDEKEGEFRVVSTPSEVKAITAAGHKVLVQKNAGKRAGFTDIKYEEAGAEIVSSCEEMFLRCDMLAKVKEFMPSEFPYIREGQILLGCIHPAANPEEVDALLKSKCIAFSAEDSHRYGSPNSEAAGKQGALFGLESMLTFNGGKGKYVGGLSGAGRIKALILGGGFAGQGALEVLHALGAECTVMDINAGVLRTLVYRYHSGISTMFCTKENIAQLLPETDLIINCVKWQKERSDFLIDREMLSLMEDGSVIVDVSNDNPGAIETSRETHHENPRYVVNGVVHYCVSNIPSAVANTTSVAYGAELLPMIMSILSDGVRGACIKDGFYRRSLTAYKGYLTHEETSAVQNKPWIRPEDILGIKEEKLDSAPPQSRTESANFYTEEIKL